MGCGLCSRSPRVVLGRGSRSSCRVATLACLPGAAFAVADRTWRSRIRSVLVLAPRPGPSPSILRDPECCRRSRPRLLPRPESVYHDADRRTLRSVSSFRPAGALDSDCGGRSVGLGRTDRRVASPAAPPPDGPRVSRSRSLSRPSSRGCYRGVVRFAGGCASPHASSMASSKPSGMRSFA